MTPGMTRHDLEMHRSGVVIGLAWGVILGFFLCLGIIVLSLPLCVDPAAPCNHLF